jgi:YD repeat-containing protein
VGLLCLPAVPSADQAQYVYDELGRLVGVVDGSGNAAVYVYDEVGS